MAKYWCNHCQRLLNIVKKRGSADNYLSCPFCGAFEWDLFSVKRHGIKIPPGKKHGDFIEYSESVKILDRERVFTENPKPKYLWCLHCGRVYEYGKFRLVKGLQMCPYPDCDGDTVVDAWAWDDFRRNAPDLYPEVPVIGEIYQQP